MRNTTSRRQLFGGTVSLMLLAATEAGAAKAQELDGDLLAAYRRWLPWEEERLRVEALPLGDETFDARYKAYTGDWHDTMAEIMELPARTPEGINAKARVMRALLDNHIGLCAIDDGSASASEQFAWSLLDDMLGRAGA